jgi:aspartate-semialdehyde dehydrogenase
MTPGPARSGRVVLVGPSTLRGRELKELIAESPLLPADIRLFDDPAAAGLLTETAGEPAVVQPLTPESFEGAEMVFFAGTPAFTARHWPDARRAGATVIDLSGALAAVDSAVPWIPTLDRTLPPPRPARGGLYSSPSAPAIIAATLAAAVARLGPARLAVVFFHPVSERGQAGIDELESQTIHLLSMQPVTPEVFDAQVAFNLLGRLGAASTEQLAEVRSGIAAEVARYLAGRLPVPAMQLVQAPVFFSYAFTALLTLPETAAAAAIEQALAEGGLVLSAAGEAPSNVSVSGERRIFLSAAEPDAAVAGAFWLWGAADNLRLSADNAVSIAERLRAS